jgi:hypothetical protein
MLAKSARLACALAATTPSLAGCYVVPVSPDGFGPVNAFVAPLAPIVAQPHPPAAPAPTLLHARLYPLNDVAAETGVVTGTVANLMNGSGRFELHLPGETLVGEATRVQSDARRGIASAFGTRGTSMSCDYRMRTPTQGTGQCTLSNGARYSVHLGG